jgi:integrase
LAETTVSNYVATIRRLAPVIGLEPTPKAIEQQIERMHKAGASYSHIVNTSIALEVYCAFIERPIKLGRPQKPHHLVRGTLSEAEVTLLIAAARTLRERTMIATLAYAGLRNRELCRLRISGHQRQPERRGQCRFGFGRRSADRLQLQYSELCLRADSDRL